MKDMIPVEELAFLARQNKEMSVEELLTEISLAKVKSAIETTLKTIAESFRLKENVRVSDISLMSFQSTQGLKKTQVYNDQPVIVFLYRSLNQVAHHLFVLSVEEVQRAFGINKIEQESSELIQLFNEILRLYYQKFSTLLDVQTEVDLMDVQIGKLEELAIVQTFDLTQLCEVKSYRFEVVQQEKQGFEMLHLSDLGFMDFLYTRMKNEPTPMNPVPQMSALAQRIAEQKASVINSGVANSEIYKPQFQSLEDQMLEPKTSDLQLLNDIPLEVSVVLGKTTRSVNEILDLYVGKVVELNKYADDPLEIYVNNKLIGEGEVMVVDENFGIKITKLYQPNLK